MTKIFEFEDKSGRKIYLSKERWAHIQKHPEMSNQIEQIRETLKNPFLITEFNYNPDVRFYYKYFKEKRLYLFISVKYLNGGGFIITSFYTDKIK